MADWELFDQVGEVVRGSVPAGLGELRLRVRHNGVKAWFGDPESAREHYEAQLIGADIVAGARTRALEIGFHAEHRKEADNAAAVERLQAAEERWRPELGDDAVIGPFVGPAAWRRVSELWLDPDLDGTDVAFEIGVRLVEYMRALEPHRATP
ncbi:MULTISPECIES: hypothetical protein [Actinomadura]|uniref:TetR family transcriptional regulator n=1 Tax=Actinomadura yumaensis TaxID=111807 RepID=A0ABW2CRN4_9ACTN|nr:hypothetical protein [Actinomadura sp. J1-007]MWK39787.1 hypothetical protein [Actinomadura sp. J1-007]